ncbi:MAG: ABC transporter permease subunit [Legionellales bacterium]|nr:ABC transporter permease subunit [Legionellales bacterium]
MPKTTLNIFNKDKIISQTNRWDLIALFLVLGLIVGLVWGAKQMTVPYQLGQPILISLNPSKLPDYALRSVLRMLIAMCFSLLFTFTFGAWAAKSKHAERIIIPAIDILQSVPILGFLSISIAGFIALFPGSLLGPECAAIFVIFTSQAWNMALGFYQSLRTLPHDLHEASDMFLLSPWQKFWRVEVPFAMPSLLWNSMISMSAGWFFVVASEAISVANHNITLPGMGSYIALAISNANSTAVFYAIVTMLVVILLYDQLLFRPIIAWSEKFKTEYDPEAAIDPPWLTILLQRTKLIRYGGIFISALTDYFINLKIFPTRKKNGLLPKSHSFTLTAVVVWYALIFLAVLATLHGLWHFIFKTLTFQDAIHVAYLGFITGLRVIVLIIICSLIWVPIGVWIGLRPRVARIIQPIAQFFAAFPANLLFPPLVLFIITFHLNVNVWCTPLMILGTQWYILFNVIAGTTSLPKDLYYAAKNFQVQGLLKWRRLILPAIFPFYVTGALSAAGGAWNASIVAEVLTWGKTTLSATGLGAYITHFTELGDYPRITLGITVMCLYVLIINRLFWKPLYNFAEERFQIL